MRWVNRPLKRDKIPTVTETGKVLVGLYFADTNGCQILMETSPKMADKIVSLWNSQCPKANQEGEQIG